MTSVSVLLACVDVARESQLLLPMAKLLKLSIPDLQETDVQLMWTLLTKCKHALDQGHRLENMSWRLWYRREFMPPDKRRTDCRSLLTVSTENLILRKNTETVETRIQPAINTSNVKNTTWSAPAHPEKYPGYPHELTQEQVLITAGKDTELVPTEPQPTQELVLKKQELLQRQDMIIKPDSDSCSLMREDAVTPDAMALLAAKATFYLDSREPSDSEYASSCSGSETSETSDCYPVAPLFCKTHVVKWEQSRRSLLSFGITHGRSMQLVQQPAMVVSDSLNRQAHIEHDCNRPVLLNPDPPPESWSMPTGVW